MFAGGATRGRSPAAFMAAGSSCESTGAGVSFHVALSAVAGVHIIGVMDTMATMGIGAEPDMSSSE